MPATTSCEVVLPLLSVYVDEEATPAEAQLIETHLPHCTRCASQLAFLRLSHQALSRPSVVPAPQSLHERIAMATYARLTLQDRLAAWLRPAPARLTLGGAAMAAVLAVAFVAVRSNPGSPPAQVATNTPPASAPSESVPSVPPTVKETPQKRSDVAVNTTRPKRDNQAAPTNKKPSPARIAAAEVRPPAPQQERVESVRPQVARREDRTPVKTPTRSQPLVIAKRTPAPQPAAPRLVVKTMPRQPVVDTAPSAPEPKAPTAPEVTPPVVIASVTPDTPPARVAADEKPRAVRGGLTADGRFQRRVNPSAMTVAYVGKGTRTRPRDFGTGSGYTGELGQGSRMDVGVVDAPVQ